MDQSLVHINRDDMNAVDKIETHIADPPKKGAKVVTGGKRAAQGAGSAGKRLSSFHRPAVSTLYSRSSNPRKAIPSRANSLTR
jgi:hypothetical protein